MIDDLAGESWLPDDAATPAAMLHLGDAQEARNGATSPWTRTRPASTPSRHLRCARASTARPAQMTKLRRRHG
ncbi:MAG: hypothetical protein R3A10_17980 [Caldilineaceae bacterium]